ncbi:phage/plasmid primase, P4 family [Pseudonocardia sp. RS010]|uniref:DNA primase family protein n=1 Tax=Pseudonocardia sp. RS010 TaxID=3385979 RepID=UPI00399F30C9
MIDYGTDHDDTEQWVDEDGQVHDDAVTRGRLRLVADDERAEEDAEVWPSPAAPLAVADEFADRRSIDGTPTIGRKAGQWWRWRGTHWAEAHDEEIRGQIYAELRDAVYMRKADDGAYTRTRWNPTGKRVSDALDALACSSAALPAGLTSGHYVTGEPASGLIPMATGVLDLETREVLPHSPRLFNDNALPYDIDPDAGAEPREWLRFLDGLFADDPDGEDKIELIRQWFGYLLSGRTDHQKGLLLVGPTRAGKGTILSVAEALVGTENTAATSFGALAGGFGLAALAGKSLAVVGDSRERPNPAALEKVLSIIGGDAVLVDRKFRDPQTVRLGSRFMIASNEVPDLGDRSAAAVGRFLILRFTRSFFGNEDLGLLDRLLAELPEVANWALVGLDRLAELRRFTEPASARAERETLTQDASPIRQFADDALVAGTGNRVPRTVLYDAWREWAERHGFRSGNVATFGRMLREALPGVGDGRVQMAGERVRFYTGVTFRRSYTGASADLSGSIEDPTLRRQALEYAVDDPD